MRADSYRNFLHRRGLGGPSISSYVSNARCVEILLSIDLDTCDLSDLGITNVSLQLSHGRRVTGLSVARMSDCMTAVRRYAEFRQREVVRQPESEKPASAPKVAEAVSDVPHTSLSALFASYNKAIDGIRAHGFLRTRNGILADYAEHLFAQAFGWTLEANSRAGYDAVDEAGQRYQIKARRIDSHGARQLSAFRRLPEAGFDMLAGVLFETSFDVRRAILVPHTTVAKRAAYIAHTNSWRFMLDDAVWTIPGTRDVTAELRAAAVRIGGSVSSSTEPLAAFEERWRSTLAYLFTRELRDQNV